MESDSSGTSYGDNDFVSDSSSDEVDSKKATETRPPIAVKDLPSISFEEFQAHKGREGGEGDNDEEEDRRLGRKRQRQKVSFANMDDARKWLFEGTCPQAPSRSMSSAVQRAVRRINRPGRTVI